MSAEEWSAVRLSLWVALWATALSLPWGILLGFVLARWAFRGKWLVEAALSVPLVLPPVVTGYVLLLILGRQGWIGRWFDQWFGVQIIFTWYAAMVASAVMAFPLMVRTIRVSMANVDRRLEQAARVHGATPWRTFFRVTLPLSKRGIVAGSLLAFARSLGEFGATIMVAGNLPGETQTIPLFIYTLVNTPGGIERCTRIVVVSLTLALLAVLVAEYLERQWRTDQAENGEP